MIVFKTHFTINEYKTATENFYKTLNSEEYETVYHYTSTGYKKLNQTVKEKTTEYKRVEILNNVFRKNTLTFIPQTYRGLTVNVEHKIGEKIIFPAYTSTSVNPFEAYNFTNKGEGTFYVLKNIQGIPVSLFNKEMELLLPPKTEFTIIDTYQKDVFFEYPDTDYGVTFNVKVVELAG